MDGLKLWDPCAMDLVGLSQALTLPHNPVQPNFAIIRLPRGTNVPAFYALLCQFGFADVKFSIRAEGWQDAVDVDTLIQPGSHSSIQETTTVPPREETPPAPSTSTVTPLSAPTTLPQVLMQLNNTVKNESIQAADSQTITPITPASQADEENIASTSVEDIVKTVLGLQKASHVRVGAGRNGTNGYTRCQKCSRLLSTTSGSLISHAISHYPVKRFGCPLCGQQFFKKSMYQDHLKSGHPDDDGVEAIDLRTERTPAGGIGGDSSGNDAIRSEWRRVATECFPNHSHLFKSKARSTSID